MAKNQRGAKPARAASSIAAPQVAGMLPAPKSTASGGVYTGRFTCPGVQWTGSGSDIMGTFTITAEQLADVAANNLLWTDQDVQRGIKPEHHEPVARELSLSAGYPDPAIYVFDVDKADDITEKLLGGEKLFLNPLVWSLRPGKFEAFWNATSSEVYLYSGKVYLPDSHHRHQAIIKAVRAWRDSPKDYPKFSGSNQFKVELYFLSQTDEGNYFYDKNQLPKPTAKSKAFDLTTHDELSLLAKQMIEKSSALAGNVNRVTDRLTAKNPQVVTLSTLREMMKAFAPSDQLDETELEGLAAVAARFFDMLAGVRPELGVMDASARKKVRERLLVDSATMMHGYAALMRDFNDDLATLGSSKAAVTWKKKLERLGSQHSYKATGWEGDFFDKSNPIWRKLGVVKPSRDGQRLTVLNTGAARIECGSTLRKFLAAPISAHANLNFLAVR